jgi:SAM-dependent methyltransferase
MGTASWVSAVVYAAARLGLADQLATEPKSAAELAGPMRMHAPSLHRLMRTLAGLGILTERDAQRFALTSLGEALKTGAPGSARATLIAFGGTFWHGWEEILYSLETGHSGFDKAHGMPLFEYLSQHPADASYFNEAMVGFHGNEPPAVAEAYDFSRFKNVVDIGGGTGNLLATILSRHAGPRGVLFDRPHVVLEAPSLLKARGVADRVMIKAGDFFETVPAGGDAYLLSHVIHDWNEDRCLTILGHCRKAIKPDGRLLIVEMVLPAGDTPHPGKVLDIVMLVFPGGQERTEAEYASLLGKAGFTLSRVVPTASAVSVVEAIPS